MATEKLTADIYAVGVNDHEIRLFEGQFPVPNGMAYNSYAILDEKVAVLDTVEASFGDEWLANLAAVLGGRPVDYLIVQHMEPDHSANILRFTQAYPQAVVVASQMAFTMMKQFYGADVAPAKLVVKDGSTLALGRHTLRFVTAPMVHWPEVVMTYDAADKLLFSADAFGKFGTTDTQEDWACEARRYYFGIVGKFGAQVQALFKKLDGLELQTICPLHGPVLQSPLADYLRLYGTWSSYGVESEGVVIAYACVYGHTKQAAEELAQKLRAAGCPKVVLTDLVHDELTEAVEDAFRYGKLVLAATTYNTGVFPAMENFIRHLTERGFCKRTVGLVENGSWAPAAAKTMRGLLEGCAELTFTSTTVCIRSALDDNSRAQLDALAKELCE